MGGYRAGEGDVDCAVKLSSSPGKGGKILLGSNEGVM